MIQNEFTCSNQYDILKSTLNEHLYNLSNINLEIEGVLEGDIENLLSNNGNGYNIKTLNLSKLDISNATTINNFFQGKYFCNTIENINISNWYLNIEDFELFTYPLNNLKILNLSNISHNINFRWPLQYINMDAIQGLEKLDFNNYTLTNDYFFDWFMVSPYLVSVNVCNWTILDTKGNGFMYYCYSDDLKSVNQYNLNAPYIKQISQFVEDCPNLISVNCNDWYVPNAFDAQSAFRNCFNLININCNNWYIPNVSGLFQCFGNCYSLENLDLSTWTIPNLQYADETFGNCYNLKNLNLFSNVQNIQDIPGMFSNCVNLININNLSTWNTWNLKNTMWMFENCINLINIDLSNWNFSNLTNASGMFENCINLTDLNLGEKNTISSVWSTVNMFRECTNLINLNLDWQTNIFNAENMFYNCKKIKSLDLSKWDFTATWGEEKNMFYGCESLCNLAFPIMNYIRQNCIDTCYNLQILNLSHYNFIPNIYNNPIPTNNLQKIVVPKNLYDNWIVTTNWTYYANYIVPFYSEILEYTKIELSTPSERISWKKTSIPLTVKIYGKVKNYEEQEIEILIEEFEDISESFEQNLSDEDILRTITYSKYGLTNTITITQIMYSIQSFSVNLKNQWREMQTINNLNKELYDGYESNSNYHQNNGEATMEIKINGYEFFEFYIYNNGEAHTYDYTVVGELDTVPTRNIYKQKIAGIQTNAAPSSLNDYTKVEFNNIDKKEHSIYIKYTKDASGNLNFDRSFILIPKNQ